MSAGGGGGCFGFAGSILLLLSVFLSFPSLLATLQHTHHTTPPPTCSRVHSNSVKPNDGSSALMLATMRGNLKAIKELTAGGADVNAKRLDTGHTVLMCALLSPFASHNAFDERFNIVEHLVRSGADREAVCNAGNTARMVAERVYRRNAFLRRVMVCMLEGDKEEAQEVLVGAGAAGAAGAGAAGAAGPGAGGAAAIEEEADDEEAEDEDGEEAEEDLMQ